MTVALPIALAGESVMLDARRALYWPSARLLALADVQLGRGALLRTGVAASSGYTSADCEEIAGLLADYQPHRLVICGDLMHAPACADEAWQSALHALRTRFAGTRFEIAQGDVNTAAPLPAELDITVAARIHAPPFVFLHQPDTAADAYGIAGHWHPVLPLRGVVDAHLPVFWMRAGYGVLPAFGGFSTGTAVEAAADDRLYTVSPQVVRAIAPPRSSSSRGSSCAS